MDPKKQEQPEADLENQQEVVDEALPEEEKPLQITVTDPETWWKGEGLGIQNSYY